MFLKSAHVGLLTAGLMFLSFDKKENLTDNTYQYPHHINISWETDPSVSQSVNWRTCELQKESFVEYPEAVPTPFFKDKAEKIKAESESHKSDNGTWNYHSVNITGLKPNTLYSYRVGTI